MDKKNIVVALSGGGRTLLNLIEKQDRYLYLISGVISSNEKCKGSSLAKNKGLPLFIGDFSRKNIDKTTPLLLNWLEKYNPSLIVLAGFLKPFPIFNKWQKKIINIHPGLLPKYGGKGMYGLNVHKAVLKNAEPFTGVTVHYANEEYDDGQIIKQVKVPVIATETPEELAAKVFKEECRIYPEVINNLLKDQ